MCVMGEAADVMLVGQTMPDHARPDHVRGNKQVVVGE